MYGEIHQNEGFSTYSNAHVDKIKDKTYLWGFIIKLADILTYSPFTTFATLFLKRHLTNDQNRYIVMTVKLFLYCFKLLLPLIRQSKHEFNLIYV